jgi:hypothetical protein
VRSAVPFLIAASGLLLGVACRSEGADDRFAARLDATTVPETVDFRFELGGTSVIRCIRPNATFSGTIDRGAGVVVLRSSGPDGPPTAVVTPAGSFIHANLLAAPPGAGWLQLPAVLGELERAALGRALGPDFAAYVLDGAATPSPVEVLEAAMDLDGDVSEAKTRGAAVFTITVDESDLDEAATGAGASPVRAAGDFQLEATFADGHITRLAVRPRTLPAARAVEDEEAAVGWTTTYQRAGSAVVPAMPDITDLSTADVAALRGAPIAACSLRP